MDEPVRYNLRSRNRHGNHTNNNPPTTPARGNRTPAARPARSVALGPHLRIDAADSSRTEDGTSSNASPIDSADGEAREREPTRPNTFHRIIHTVYLLYLAFVVSVNLIWFVPDAHIIGYKVEVETLDMLSEVLNLTERFSPLFLDLSAAIGPAQLRNRRSEGGFKCPASVFHDENEEGDEVCFPGPNPVCRAKDEVPEVCLQGAPLDPMAPLDRLQSVVDALHGGIRIPCGNLLRPNQARGPLSGEDHAYFQSWCSVSDVLYEAIRDDLRDIRIQIRPVWMHLRQQLYVIGGILAPQVHYLLSLGSLETLGTGFNPPTYLNPATRRHPTHGGPDDFFKPRWFCWLRAKGWWLGPPCHFDQILNRPSPPLGPAHRMLHELEKIVAQTPWLPYCDAHPSELRPDMDRQKEPVPPLRNPLRQVPQTDVGDAPLNKLLTDLTNLDDALEKLMKIPRRILDDGVLNLTWWKPLTGYWDDRGGNTRHYLERTEVLVDHASALVTGIHSLLDGFSDALYANREICAISEELLERISLLMSGRGWWSLSMEVDGASGGKARPVLKYAVITTPDEAVDKIVKTVDRIVEVDESFMARWREWGNTRDLQIQEWAWQMANCEELVHNKDVDWYIKCRIYLDKA